jgi:hypothetical protein
MTFNSAKFDSPPNEVLSWPYRSWAKGIHSHPVILH